MIEQFSPGLPQISKPAAGTLRDRQASGEQDEKSDRFEDLVSNAPDSRSAQSKKDRNGEQTVVANGVKLSRPSDVLPKAVVELSAALKGLSSSPQAKLSAQVSVSSQTRQSPQADVLNTEKLSSRADVASSGKPASRAETTPHARLSDQTDLSSRSRSSTRADPASKADLSLDTKLPSQVDRLSHANPTSPTGQSHATPAEAELPRSGQSRADSSDSRLPSTKPSQEDLSEAGFSRTDIARPLPSQVDPFKTDALDANPLQADPTRVDLAPVRTRLASIGDELKSADKAERTEREADAVLEKLVEKTKQGEAFAMPDAGNDEVAEQQPLTPSDELSLLLGLTTQVDAKSGSRAASADADDISDKTADSDDTGIDRPDGAFDVQGRDAMLVTLDARLGDDRPATTSDDPGQRGDVVRIVGANGRGRAIDIDVPAASGTQSQDGAKTSTAPKIETASVLEVRRYLGFSTETNGAALAAAVKADPTWAGALQSVQRTDVGALANTVTEVNTLKLEMNPEHLGSMVASLKLKGEELTVELRVNSVEAYHRLTADQDDIVKSLQDQGFSIDKVTVQLNATDKSDPGADRDMARQGQRDQQTAQREGQGGQSGRNDGQRESQPRWTPSGERADGTPGDSPSDLGRSGNLYL